ncbi:polysaccharide pyruvyl transferase family protein [Thiomicrorhabdus sp.]|uniref:polysaccharide pyruvyl transferase family protein n=1 Tax=Thiomicrorhabdus sp. TaxID=2039724 RepID=UPI0029C64834|nr:polysaccharide pyruvyl transferase family protein [Thiomicrorhabdus sp.]
MLKTILKPYVHKVRLLNFSRNLHVDGSLGIDSHKSLIIPAAAPGGLGDDAMVKASISAIHSLNPRKDISVLVPTNFPDSFSFNNEVDYEKKLNAWRHPQKEVAMMGQYENVYFLGADILDGALNLPDSVKRIKMAGLFREQGQNSRIIGFSLNKSPLPEVIREFNNLKDVPLFLRDPVSYQRAKSLIKGDVVLSADVAFLLEPKLSEVSEIVEKFTFKEKQRGNITIGINVHSMLANFSKEGTMEKLLKSIANLIETTPGCSFVFIPHDYRDISDDRVPLTVIENLLSDRAKKRILNLTKPMRADEIKKVCSYLDGVLTARMHIAIASLGMGVPVLGIVYQGKFEGTFSHFGFEKGFTFEPEEAANEDILKKRFDEWLLRLDMHKISVIERLPFVKELALKNFE